MGSKVIFLLALLLLFPLVSAAPPVTIVQQFTEGYTIGEAQQGTIIYDHDYTYNFFLENSSNGVNIDNSTTYCNFFLADIYGALLFTKNVTYTSDGYWNIVIEAGNFSYIGEYPYGVKCQDTTIGGSLTGTFYAGYSGRILDAGEALLYIPLFLMLFFLFGIIFYGMNMLPARNTRDEEGKIMSISYLKYLRSVFMMTLWGIVIGMLFLSANLSFAYSPDTMMATFFLMLFKVCFALTPVIVIVWLIWIFASMFHDRRFQQMLNRGMFPQGTV